MSRPDVLRPGDALGHDFRVVRLVRGTARRWIYEVTDRNPELRTRTCWSCRFPGVPRADAMCPHCGRSVSDRTFLASVRWGAQGQEAWQDVAARGFSHPAFEAPVVVFPHEGTLVSVSPTTGAHLLLDEPAPLPVQTVLDAGRVLGDALRYLAGRGVLVSHFGPEHLLLTPDGQPRLFDLDVSREPAIDPSELLLVLGGYLAARPGSTSSALDVRDAGPTGMDEREAPPAARDAAALTDAGLVRDHNEDAWAWAEVGDGATLYAVADGLGGHRAGHVASRLALDTLRSAVTAALRSQTLTDQEVLVAAFREADQAVRSGGRDPSKRGMGTTLVGALVRTDSAVIGHVGDSRAYLFRDGVLTSLTEDHTVVAALIRAGQVEPEEAREHPMAHMLSRAIGTDPLAEDPDVCAVDLRAGDRLILCTDGVWGVLGYAKLQRTLSNHAGAREACRAVAQEVLARGAHDNFTVLVVDAARSEDGSPEGDAERAVCERCGVRVLVKQDRWSVCPACAEVT